MYPALSAWWRFMATASIFCLLLVRPAAAYDDFPVAAPLVDAEAVARRSHQGEEDEHVQHVQHGHAAAHGAETYHSLEMIAAAGRTDDGDDFFNMQYHGWWGNDKHKLFVMGELHRHDNVSEEVEYWFLYSRNVSEFWDLQVGWRHDTQPDPLGHIVLGAHGLAWYFIETGLHASMSEQGDINIRLHLYRDLLLTNKMVLTPYLELDASTRDVPAREISSGLGQGEFGLRLRYEVTPQFAPFIDVRIEHDFGDEQESGGGGGDTHGHNAQGGDEHGHDDTVWVFLAGIRILL